MSDKEREVEELTEQELSQVYGGILGTTYGGDGVKSPRTRAREANSSSGGHYPSKE